MKPWCLSAQRHLLTGLVCFVILAIFPFSPSPASDLKVLGYELFACLALILRALGESDTEERACASRPLFPFTWVFLGLGIVAASLSLNPEYSLTRECVKLLALIVIIHVAADALRTPEHVWKLLGWVCVAMSFASIYGVLQSVGLDPFPWEDTIGMRRFGPATLGNPNIASHVLMPTIILACGLSTQRRGRWAIVCIPLFVYHFFLTWTRGSFVAMAGACLTVFAVLIIATKVKRPSRVIALTSVAVSVLVALAVAAVTLVTEARTGVPYPDDGTLTLRFHSFYDACLMIKDRPWLGFGPGMFQIADADYRTPLENERAAVLKEVNDRVHNEPLEITVETGILGGALFIGLLFFCIHKNFVMALTHTACERRILGLTLGAFFVAFFIDGLFGFNVHVPASAVLFSVMAGATVGVWRENKPQASTPLRIHRRLSYLRRLGALGCAVVLAVFGVRDFAALVLLQRGMGAMESKAYADAAACLTKARSLAPYDWRILFQLGTTYSRMGSNDLAATNLARAVELHPGDTVAIVDAAKAYFNLAASSPGEEATPYINSAIAYANRALHLNSYLPDVHDIMGRICMLRAETSTGPKSEGEPTPLSSAWQEAERHLTRAIECGHADRAEVHRLIAKTRIQRNDVRGARQALVSSLEDKSDNMPTWEDYLQASKSAGEYDDLLASLEWHIELLNRAQKSSKDYIPLELLRAQVLSENFGDNTAARDSLVDIVKNKPERVDVWAAFHRFTKHSGTEQFFNSTFLSLVPEPDAPGKVLPPQVESVALGLREGSQGVKNGVSKLVDALIASQRSTTETKGLANQFCWAADVLVARAMEVELSKEISGEVYLKLGYVYEACQEFATAAAMFEKALPSLSGEQHLVCLLQRGGALIKAGKADMAVHVFEQIVAANPSSLDGQLGLAQSLAQSGQRAKARVAFRRVLATFPLSDEQRALIQHEIGSLSE